MWSVGVHDAGLGDLKTKKKPTTTDEKRNAAEFLKRRVQQSAEDALKKLEQARMEASQQDE
jgi:hypothetical protein